MKLVLLAILGFAAPSFAAGPSIQKESISPIERKITDLNPNPDENFGTRTFTLAISERDDRIVGHKIYYFEGVDESLGMTLQELATQVESCNGKVKLDTLFGSPHYVAEGFFTWTISYWGKIYQYECR